MRWYFIFIIALLLNGCNTRIKEAESNILTVSIRPQKYIVEQLTGDRFTINVLVPDGSGPETYEPTAKQMKEISRSKAIFMTGLLDFEKSWLPKVGRLYPEVNIVNTSQGIVLLDGHGSHDNEDIHDHSGIDPHIWLSLRSIKIQSANILSQLVIIDSLNKDIYITNHSEFCKRLDKVDSTIVNKLKSIDKPSFMIYHPSLSYYAKEYGVEQISIEIEGKEPSPAYMVELIDMAKEKRIRTIFYSQQFDLRSAETIANQLGISLTAFDPLAENVEKNLLQVTDQIINPTHK